MEVHSGNSLGVELRLELPCLELSFEALSDRSGPRIGFERDDEVHVVSEVCALVKSCGHSTKDDKTDLATAELLQEPEEVHIGTLHVARGKPS